ncbi:MAG: cytochrome b/b6 domain-containing protein [Paracoccaceae bacterium]
MSTPIFEANPSRHLRSTRLVHAGLALSICLQLGSSLVMKGPSETASGDLAFQLHRYSGFAAMAFALMFWIIVFSRHKGTSAGALFPWFSPTRRRAFFSDLTEHLWAALRLKLPAFDEVGALPSGIHGLGLLLVAAMAASGTLYAIEVAMGIHSAKPDGMYAMTIHFALGNLVWAYLIGHAALGTLHHFVGSASLARMWRLGS